MPNSNASKNLVCEYANEEGRIHRKQECTLPATQRVRHVLGVSYYCERHATIVRMVEAEWDQAEAEEFTRDNF